jgi:ComF family protein
MDLVPELFSTLFPSRCIFCQRTLVQPAFKGLDANPHIEICEDCFRILPHNDCCCVRCALPLAEEAGAAVLCGRCIKKAPAFDYVYSLFRYEDDIIRLVHQLKFSEKITCARSLGEMLLLQLQAKLPNVKQQPDCLLPVPLHPARLRRRGFNQSIEIARIISRRLQIPIEYDAVIRQRKTTSQTGLDVRQRQKNIRGAFEVVTEIKAKHILIIDDVMTTGATVNELARVLKKNNVARVGVLSAARAPLKN